MKSFIIILGLFICLTACKKEIQVDSIDFAVSTTRTSYKVGDTVFFSLSGNADIITFYSGKPGFNYENRNRVIEKGGPQLNFTTTLTNAGQTNSLRLLVSNNFSGIYDSINIASATWKDITDRAILSPGTPNTASGDISLGDLDTTVPIYFAFQYKTIQDPANQQPAWSIGSFNLSNRTADGKVNSIASLPEVGWALFNFSNPTIKWVQSTSGQLSINSSSGSGLANNDWAISKGYDLKQTTPDVGIPIKGVGGNAIKTYYTLDYVQPGSYNIVFVAKNVNKDDAQTIVRRITIEILP